MPPPNKFTKKYKGMENLQPENLVFAQDTEGGDGVPSSNPFNCDAPANMPSSFGRVDNDDHVVQVFNEPYTIHDEYYSDKSDHHSHNTPHRVLHHRRRRSDTADDYYDCGTDREIDTGAEECIITPRLSQTSVLEYTDTDIVDDHDNDHNHDSEHEHDSVIRQNTLLNTRNDDSVPITAATFNGGGDHMWVYAGVAIIAVFLFFAFTTSSKNKK